MVSCLAGIGPEIGYRFQAAGRTMGIDFRWYYEFAARNRVERNLSCAMRILTADNIAQVLDCE
jgi:hypothetical protein